MRAHRGCDVGEMRDDIIGALELREMSDALRRFEREAKILGGLHGPLLEHLALGHRAEGIVDFDGGQPVRVVAKEP